MKKTTSVFIAVLLLATMSTWSAWAANGNDNSKVSNGKGNNKQGVFLKQNQIETVNAEEGVEDDSSPSQDKNGKGIVNNSNKGKGQNSKNNKGNGKKEINAEESTGDSTAESIEEGTEESDTVLEDLKEQLKSSHKNKEKSKELVRQIVEVKKQSNFNGMSVFVKGQDVKFDTPPVIKEGRTLIPVRAVTNALGAQVEWDPDTSTATITRGDIVIVMDLKNKVVTVNGEIVKLLVSPEINNNRTFVPLRFIAETFNLKVDWDDESDSAIIEDGDYSEVEAGDLKAEATDKNSIVVTLSAIDQEGIEYIFGEAAASSFEVNYGSDEYIHVKEAQIADGGKSVKLTLAGKLTADARKSVDGFVYDVDVSIVGAWTRDQNDHVIQVENIKVADRIMAAMNKPVLKSESTNIVIVSFDEDVAVKDEDYLKDLFKVTSGDTTYVPGTDFTIVSAMTSKGTIGFEIVITKPDLEDEKVTFKLINPEYLQDLAGNGVIAAEARTLSITTD